VKRRNHVHELPPSANKELNLKETIILYDRDRGISIYPNFRSYDNLTDDAEWLLERTPQKSRGFIIRPITKHEQEGIWIGEYNCQGSQITRQEFLLCEKASSLGKVIADCFQRKITEKELMKEIDIDQLKKRLESKIPHTHR